MNIRILKSNLQTAVAPLLRVPDSDGTVTLFAESKVLALTVSSENVQLTTEAEAESVTGEGAVTVDLKLLRAALDTTASTIELDDAKGLLTVRGGKSSVSYLPHRKRDTAVGGLRIPDNPESTVLPTDFAGFLISAFQAASSDQTRRILTGVNVSSRGIAGTDGHVLNHIPLPMPHLLDEVTLPPSPVYRALRRFRWVTLSFWQEKSVRWAAVQGMGFTLFIRALEGRYPSYETVFPDAKSQDTRAEILSATRLQMVDFLKSVPQEGSRQTDVWLHPDRIELSDRQNRRIRVQATCTGKVLPLGFCCNATFLQEALKLGHTALSLNSREIGVLEATGGSGRYLFMPLKDRPQKPDSSPVPETGTKEEHAEAASPAIPAPQPSEASGMENTQPITAKESNTMTQQAQAAVAAMPQTETDPLTEITASLTAMRDMIAELQTRLQDAGRMVRRVSVTQKQRDRAYQNATQKLERIRLQMAS